MQDTSWIDREAYPFQSNYFESPDGRIHFLDEGEGEAVVMLHGSLTWSFLYRDFIKTLAPGYRCIVPDHLGFGLSDKPAQAAYRPADHALRLQQLIEHLQLDNFSLVVHDFGGPIGLSYALEHPQAIRSMIILNTWMWPLRGEGVAHIAGLMSRGKPGKFIFQNLNFELQVLFPQVWGKRSKLGKELHQQYLKPFPDAESRLAITAFARELLGSSDWYEKLWQQRDRIKEIPALLLWGMKDPIFKQKHLARWQSLFSDTKTVTFPTAGHFLQEEGGAFLLNSLKEFLSEQFSGNK